MLTLIGDYTQAGATALYNVIAHELGHMWVPMQISVDERRYSWIDEGLTTFNENQARMEFFPGVDHDLPDMRSYLNWAGTGHEGEMMRQSAFHYSSQAYTIASYQKPATAMAALRGVLGTEVFDKAYQTFLREWRYKHPYPWDLWSTFERVSGQNLDWFWRSWYFETWTMDQAVQAVAGTPTGTVITIEDQGDLPLPVDLTIAFEDGHIQRERIPVDTWLAGGREASITIHGASPVTRVEIDAQMQFPDNDRADNIWMR